MCDANARIGSVGCASIGSYAADDECVQGALFREFLQEFGLCVPQTFEEMHDHTPSYTYCSTLNGILTKHRIDYVAVPLALDALGVQAGTHPFFADAALLSDHIPPLARVAGWSENANKWKFRRTCDFDRASITREIHSEHPIMRTLNSIFAEYPQLSGLLNLMCIPRYTSLMMLQGEGYATGSPNLLVLPLRLISPGKPFKL